MRKRIQPLLLISSVLAGTAVGMAWITVLRAADDAAADKSATAKFDLTLPAIPPPDPLPGYLQNTTLPSTFSAPFDAYARVLLLPPKTAGINWIPYFVSEPAGTGTLNYVNNASQFAMRADWTMCPPFPGIPEKFWGLPCSFYALQQPDEQGTVLEYVTYCFCTDPDVMSYTLYTKNVGPLLPDAVINYHQFDPHAPLDAPLQSSRLPAPQSYSTEGVQWFTTGGPPPAWDQGYFAFWENKTVSSGGTTHKIPFSFAGGHMGPRGQFYIQAVYNQTDFTATPTFALGFFDLPTGYKFLDLPSFTIPLESKYKPTQSTNCTACHASN